MSEAAHNLIDAFSALPVAERHAVLIELVRMSQGEAGDISDDELAFAGEQIFTMYDAEEAVRGESNSA